MNISSFFVAARLFRLTILSNINALIIISSTFQIKSLKRHIRPFIENKKKWQIAHKVGLKEGAAEKNIHILVNVILCQLNDVNSCRSFVKYIA